MCFSPTCSRPSRVRWIVTHLLGWAPFVVIAVIKESSSSFFSFSFFTRLSMARLEKLSLSPPCRWHIKLCTILRQASLLVGVFVMDILDVFWVVTQQNLKEASLVYQFIPLATAVSRGVGSSIRQCLLQRCGVGVWIQWTSASVRQLRGWQHQSKFMRELAGCKYNNFFVASWGLSHMWFA